MEVNKKANLLYCVEVVKVEVEAEVAEEVEVVMEWERHAE